MKLALDINQQNALAIAFGQLDSYEIVTPGVADGAKVVRVPYKLGAARRAVVKNSNALNTSLQSYEEARVALVKEMWPTLADGESIKKADDPETFARYQAELQKIRAAKDEFDLLPLLASTMYGDEFPIAALELLEQHGLIEDAVASA